jgi:hypothetical protein
MTSAMLKQIVLIGIGVLSSMGLSVPVSSQTQFQWPNTPVEISRYTHLEECVAAVKRVRDSIANADGVWRDTFSLGAIPAEAQIPIPLPAVQIGRSCGVSFKIQDVPANEFRWTLDMLLILGRDEDVKELVTKRLTLLTPDMKAERLYLIDTIALSYLSARPARIAEAETLIAEIAESDIILPLRNRTDLYKAFFDVAVEIGDTARARRVGDLILALPTTMTEEERRQDPLLFNLLVSEVHTHLNRSSYCDSLRKSTASYVTMQKQEWERLMTGGFNIPMQLPIGKPAMPLQGEYRYPNSNNLPLPQKGKTSLLLFLNLSWPEGAAIARLAQRFPELDIILVAQTTRARNEHLYNDSGEEADSIWSMARNFYKYPGKLIVAETRFWRLQNPDARVFQDEENENVKYYAGEYWSGSFENRAILIDSEGIIVHSMPLNRVTEVVLAEFIEALLSRDGR